jgi:hypothetical protein
MSLLSHLLVLHFDQTSLALLMSSSNWPHIKLQRELLICLAMHLFVLHLEHIVCFTSWTCYLFMPSPSRNQTPTNIMFLRLVVFWSPLHFEIIVSWKCVTPLLLLFAMVFVARYGLWQAKLLFHYCSYFLLFLLLGFKSHYFQSVRQQENGLYKEHVWCCF